VSGVDGWWQACVYGAFLGLVIYVVFNGTALVTFPNWTFRAAGIDTVWGVVLLACAGLAGYAVKQHMSAPPPQPEQADAGASQ
jgi:uncharacterized membrane protein